MSTIFFVLSALTACSNVGPDTGAPLDGDSAVDTASPPAHTLLDADSTADSLGEAEVTGQLLYYVDSDVSLPSLGLDGGLVVIPDARDAVVVGDMDGDGLSDLLLTLHPGTPDQTLSVVSRTGAELYSTDIGDLGQPDVWAAGSDALALGATAAVTVYATDDVVFRTPLNTIVALDAILTQVEEADFTGDGVDDHVVVSQTYPDDYGPGKIWILDGADRGVTDGEADAYASLTGNDTTGLIQAAPRPADINEDGRLDLVVQDQGLSIYDGSIHGIIDPYTPLTRVSGIYDCQVIDFDGDGIPDIGGVPQDEDIESRSVGFGVLFGTPAGSVDFDTSIDWRLGEGESGRIVALDIDTDGDDDIVFQAEGFTYLFEGGPERARE